MIFAVTDRCKPFRAVATQVRLLAGVSPHMHEQVPFFGEDLAASGFQALKEVVTGMSGFDVKVQTRGSRE